MMRHTLYTVNRKKCYIVIANGKLSIGKCGLDQYGHPTFKYVCILHVLHNIDGISANTTFCKIEELLFIEPIFEGVLSKLSRLNKNSKMNLLHPFIDKFPEYLI